MESFKHFQLNIENNIAHLSFNRPEKANSLNNAAWKELGEAFEALDKNEEVRVIILKGNGKNFSGGMDLEALMSLQSFQQLECDGRKREKLRTHIQFLQNSINSIEICRKPVIASIHGACIGGAVDIIAACDMRYATEDAVFSIREIQLGMVADLGTLQRLPKFMNSGYVTELAYTGRNFSGIEAAHFGLVTEALNSKEALDKKVLELAGSIAAQSPLSVRGTKQMLLYARDHSVNDALDTMVNWNTSMLLSSDLMEAFTAFVEKRKPVYKN